MVVLGEGVLSYERGTPVCESNVRVLRIETGCVPRTCEARACLDSISQGDRICPDLRYFEPRW